MSKPADPVHGRLHGTLQLQDLLIALKGLKNWFVFGVILGVPKSELNKIEQQHTKDIERCKLEMLQHWLDDKLVPTWNDIVQTLEKTDQFDLASQIKLDYLSPSGSTSLTADEIKAEPIRAGAAIVSDLKKLEIAFARMILRVKRHLEKCDLSEAKLFLRSATGTKDFNGCENFGELLEQLQQDYIDVFNISILQQLVACFDTHDQIYAIETYIENKESFLKQTTVLEFQRAVVSRVKPILASGKALLTIKISEELAYHRTLKDIEKLAIDGFDECHKQFVCLHAEPGSIIISWMFPKELSGRLEQLAHTNAAVFKDFGVVQVTVGESRVFPCTQQDFSVISQGSPHMAVNQLAVGGSSPAVTEALKHSFSYLLNNIDTAALLPAALSRNLITYHQRTECFNEADLYKKPMIFLCHLQQAVITNYSNYVLFSLILYETGQAQIAFRLHDELAHSIRSMQKSSSIDKGEQVELVSETLVEELADLRFAFAKLIHDFEKQICNSPEAQEEFVAFLPQLFHRTVEYHSFQSHFNTLVEEEVSLFNIFYLKKLCSIFREDVRTTTTQLVNEYEQRRYHFMSSVTMSQFKQLFPATATSSKLSSSEKVSFTLRLRDNYTLQDLTKLIINLSDSSNHLHLSKVEDDCRAVTWLCSTSEVKQLNRAVIEATNLLQSKGMLQAFIGEEELKLDWSKSHPSPTSSSVAIVKRLERPSDELPQSSGVQTDKPIAASPLSAKESHKLDTAVHLEPQVIQIEYQCPVCFEMFIDDCIPYLTDCGHHLCKKCFEYLLNTSKTECPTCREETLNSARRDTYFHRLVKDLKVSCSDYEEGCLWSGELRDLHDHLDQCASCPFGCGKNARSIDMKKHTRHCLDQTTSCKKCGYYNTFTIVTRKHNPICPQTTTRAMTRATASSQYRYNVAPKEFIIGDFKKKQANKAQLSWPLYSHIRGYKFHLNVHPNGIDNGSGSHFSVHAELKRGEYDDELKWPFEGDILIELLNWRKDKNKEKENKKEWKKEEDEMKEEQKKKKEEKKEEEMKEKEVKREKDEKKKEEVVKKEREEKAVKKETEEYKDYSATICFNRHNHTVYRVTSQDTPTRLGQPDQFISHTDLKPTNNTRYFLCDFFKLRVDVAVYSTPLLSLSPSWQMSTSHDDFSMPIITQFTISEFSKRKEFNNMYFSEPFTTGLQGYKFSIKAMANGCKSGKGSNITMSAVIMKGQHDEHLKWPFTGTIIIEVLNWLEDNRHHKQVFSIDPNDDIVRVTQGEYGKDFGFYKFISHASLPFNSSTNTQYLFKDCICVRVRKSRADDDYIVQYNTQSN